MKNDVGQLFQRTLPDVEPRMGYSVDETVTAGRRRRNRVRAGYAGGGGLAVVAVAALSLSLLPGAASPAPRDDDGERGGTGAAADTDRPPVDRDALATEIAGIVESGHDGMTVEPHSTEEFQLGWFDDATGNWETGDSDHFQLRTFVYDADKSFGGMVTVGLYAPGSFHDEPMEVKPGQDPPGTLLYCAKTTCVKSTTDDGDTLYKQADVSGQGGIVADHALVVRTDGTAVIATSTCGDLGESADGESLDCDRSLLSVDELADIATTVPPVTEVFES